jgi:ATP-dependent RNA helicase RhlE
MIGDRFADSRKTNKRMNKFSELPLNALLKSNLARHGFVVPTAVQLEAIQPALEGRDLVATAQTGTGKTLAFVLPIIERLTSTPALPGIRTVVLAPTRELAIQIHEAFTMMAAGSGIHAAIAVGGLNEQTQLQTIRKGAQVLIATPGRMFDFVGRKLLNLRNVQILVLDEADRMLDMGFLPTIKKLMAAMPVERQTLFFSATIESSVKHLVETHVRNPVRITVGSTTTPIDKVALHVYEVEQDRKLGLLASMLRKEEGSFLVFARTKHGADRLAKKLSREGMKAAVIHGNRSQNQRNMALRGFQERTYRVLVATDVAARGIHVEGIAHVVNYDLPQVPEDFIHRVGRTGRAGASGTASTFATRGERQEIAKIERTISAKLQKREVPADLPREAKHVAEVIVMPSGPQRRHTNTTKSFAPRQKGNRRRVV